MSSVVSLVTVSGLAPSPKNPSQLVGSEGGGGDVGAWAVATSARTRIAPSSIPARCWKLRSQLAMRKPCLCVGDALLARRAVRARLQRKVGTGRLPRLAVRARLACCGAAPHGRLPDR